jgi:molybdopterin-biosynthesis enzyme MoeA-like protein
MGFAAIIVGDEILSGRRADRHLGKAIELLGARGLDLAWASYLGDDRQRLTETLRRTLAGTDVVFVFGGIGVTPDDHTRQAAAAALGVPLELHPEARREIEHRFGQEVTRERLMLGEFPRGSVIVPNPYNRIPGFSVGHHFFLPGFPEMAWPMMAWVLDTRYAHLHHVARRGEASVIVHFNSESRLLDLMERIEADWPGVRVFSLPASAGTAPRPQIELGVKGDPDQVAPAMEAIRLELARRSIAWDEPRE